VKVVRDFPYAVRVLENVWIPAADGTRLAARVWLPETTDPVPAVFEYIPYRKRDLTRSRDSIHAPYVAGHGYAYVRVDIRGCGDSGGHIDDQYSEAELADGEQIIQWLARQPWCDGRVGMMGISWGGFNALQIAARRPPALGAIVTVCSTDDTFRDNMHYMGGCLLGDNLSEATTMLAYQTCPPDPEIVGERWRAMWRERLETHEPWLLPWLRHQRRGPYWEATSVCEDYAAIQCPVMTVSGWADGFTNAVLRLIERLRVPRKGLIGPWSHMYPHIGRPGPAIGFLQEAIAWFDHWLKGEENGAMDGPTLRVWMQDGVPPQFSSYEERPGRWVAEDGWPSRGVRYRTLAFAEHGLRLDETPDDDAAPRSIRSPLSTGLYAGKWCSYAATPDLPGDQREEDGGALVFESEPLPEDLEILGVPRVDLRVAADRPVAQVAVRLSEVLPDGRATRVTYGLQNLTHRHGSEAPEPLEPGSPVDVRVDLNACAQRFARGHRLRVSISSSYWPIAWPPPEPTTLTLHPRRCALLLPVRARDGRSAAIRFAAPEGAAPHVPRYITPGQENWRVIRDLAADTATLECVRHDGHFAIDEIDLEVEKRTLETYSSRADDFGSVRGETRTTRGFSRGEWQTRVETRSVLTADRRRFRLHVVVDAFERDERVFARTWTEEIERDLM